MSKILYNYAEQEYKGIGIKLIQRNYGGVKAKRYVLIPPTNASNAVLTNQNIWIPNKHLCEDGTVIPDQDLDYVFRKATRQLELAGYTNFIIGIKRRNVTV